MTPTLAGVPKQPWRVERARNPHEAHVIDAEGLSVATVFGVIDCPLTPALIAAAPDLLAACERGLAALRSALDAACLGEGADVDALVAAIEKARAK
jgi:hypothetical protein